MLKKILAYTVCLCSFYGYSQSQNCDDFWMNDAWTLENLSPSERVTYFNGVSTDCEYENTDWNDGRINYSEQNLEWTISVFKRGFPHWNTGSYWTQMYYATYKRYYKDTDNDGFADSPNDYVYFINGSYDNTIIIQPVGGSLRLPTTYSYDGEYLTSNQHNYTVINDSGNTTDFTSNSKVYFYNGYHWVKNLYGFDCDDSNSSIPAAIERIYPDFDGDGFGSNESNPIYHYTGSVFVLLNRYKVVGCTYDYPYPFGYAYNNDDCNDLESEVTTNPIDWYGDFDEDSFGNPNDVINACKRPDGYVSNPDDCNDNNYKYNIEQITWYADFDEDGFGDPNDVITASCPPANYVTECYFDDCPLEAGTRTNGCPVIVYNFDNENKNYTYERVYLDEFKIDELQNATSEDVLEQIVYYDGAKRAKQQIAIGFAQEGKDVMQHFEYDGNGQSTKSYLPFMSSTGGLYESNALAGTLDFYNTSDFENTTNPYSETITEASPIAKVLEQGAPGEDWLVDTESDYDHTIKYKYDMDTSNTIKKFSVNHSDDFIENTELNYDGFYLSNELSMLVVKNENWQPNPNPGIVEKNNTEETYTNHLGQVILKRVYADDEPHDTYYVYDDLGSLTYVLPPTASDQILEFGEQAFRSATQTNYSWINLVNIDKEFADDYNKQLSEYDNSVILNADIENKYGGQGGFTVTTYTDSDLVTLSINFSALEHFELKQGHLISLKPYGDFKDTEIGRISGADYEYVFYIKGNEIVIDGGGKLNNVNTTLNSNTKLEYDKNYLWVQYTEVDEKFAYEYENNLKQIAKDTGESILDVSDNIENQYGGQGGLNVTIDTDDNVTLNFNSSSSTPLKLKKGVILKLDSKRKLQNRELGSITGTNFNYDFSLEDNAIVVRGAGDVMSFNGTIFTPNPPPPPLLDPQTVEGLSYIYHYDYRNRIVEKKTPDKGWEHIVYNKLDQPVLTQDAKMRLNFQWQFIKYDALGRAIYSGLFKYGPTGNEDNSSRIELQQIMNSQTLFYEKNTISAQSINDTNVYYTNDTYPNYELELHSINYYDDYSGLEVSNTELIREEGDNIYDETISKATKNLPTFSKTRVLETDRWITNVIYYDDKSSPIFVASKNDYLRTVDVVNIDTDFMGKVLETKAEHIKQITNCEPVTDEDPFPNCTDYSISVGTIDTFTYDRVGRLLTQTQNVNGTPPELIVNNTYNELGQLVSKKVGGSVATSAPEDSQGLQSVDYSYNIRGWLKTINDGVTQGTDLFGFKLNYNSTELNGAIPLYNGNISETHWTAKDHHNEALARAYDYNYDELNRLRSATYHTINSDDVEDYSVKMNYDKNGNILALVRIGQVITNSMVNNTPAETISMDYIDILSYSYGDKSNQLNNVKDTATKDGFMDGNNYGESGDNDYLYDINGNLIKDLNKKISITYNHLNLPTEIRYGGSNTEKINYTYSADGRKLSKLVTNGENINTSLYAGKFIYENNALKVFSQPEGYAEPNNSGGFDYVYQYKDHLGNIRLSYKDKNNNNQIEAENEIVLVKAYYPFGLEHQGGYNITAADANTVASKFKYNGTELEESFGVNLYEMPFRQYDPAIARWTSIDPITHFSMSPYTGFDNNPVYWADPSGADSEGYYGMYDLEWGGYMMNPGDPGYSDEGQVAGMAPYHYSNFDTMLVEKELPSVKYRNPFEEFGFELDFDDNSHSNSDEEVANMFGTASLTFNFVGSVGMPILNNQIPKINLNSFELRGGYNPNVGYESMKLNKGGMLTNGRIYQVGTKEAIRSLTYLRYATAAVSTVGNVASFSTAGTELLNKNYRGGFVEGTSAATGWMYAKYFGWIYGLGWAAGWEQGRILSTTELYNRYFYGVGSEVWTNRAHIYEWDNVEFVGSRAYLKNN